MPTNRIQFQLGMSIHEFMDRYGSEAQCAQAMARLRWPEGFRFPRCGGADHCRFRQGARVLMQCRGLSGSAGVIDADCAHSYIVVDQRMPRELSAFKWVNTLLSNLKTAISGAHKAFKFGKYGTQYLGAFSYRFNHRFDLRSLVVQLIGDAAYTRPLRQRAIRGGAEVHA